MTQKISPKRVRWASSAGCLAVTTWCRCSSGATGVSESDLRDLAADPVFLASVSRLPHARRRLGNRLRRGDGLATRRGRACARRSAGWRVAELDLRDPCQSVSSLARSGQQPTKGQSTLRSSACHGNAISPSRQAGRAARNCASPISVSRTLGGAPVVAAHLARDQPLVLGDPQGHATWRWRSMPTKSAMSEGFFLALLGDARRTHHPTRVRPNRTQMRFDPPIDDPGGSTDMVADTVVKAEFTLSTNHSDHAL